MDIQSAEDLETGAAREQYNRLLAQRRALEQLVKVSESLERLHSGLQAVVLMGQPSDAVSESALRFFQGLSDTTRQQPTEKLRAGLAALEERIRNNIARIITLSDYEADDVGAYDDEAHKLIGEFRRSSQTAVALRILLTERGEPTDATVLPIKQAVLKDKAEKVAARERQCRVEVEKGIVRTIETTRAMANDKSVPAIARAALNSSLMQLERELAHVRAGRSMEALSEAAEAPAPAAEQSAAREPATAPAPADVPKRRGFLSAFREWLNTPWHVGWREIRKRTGGDT